jgi:hypothetical protein
VSEGAGGTSVLRVANGSGFYGDRPTAMRELVEGGPLDVLTGDYLAELTMLVLWRSSQRRPDGGTARTFLRHLRDVLVPCLDRGIRVVSNAGGLAPAVLADGVRELASELGVEVRVSHVEGDDLRERIAELQAAGHELADLATGTPLATAGIPVLTANAYLGARGIAAALAADADVVVTGRVTDASLTVGPGLWRFGWGPGDLDALAGATVAGHVLECGAQATGGNYPFFTEIPGLEHVGFPIAELQADGSSVITKHPGTGGAVTVGTVTAQLLYEIDAPAYLGPDVTTRFDTIRLTQEAPDRVAIAPVRGTPPPPQLKVVLSTLGGFRNRATFLLTGLDIEAKADLVQRQLARAIDLDALDRVHWQLTRSDHLDAPTNAEATATLTLTVHHHDADAIGRRGFADACVALALASYPGCSLTAPPSDAEPFGRTWPTLLPAHEVTEVVVHHDGRREQLVRPAAVAPSMEPLPVPASPGPAEVDAVRALPSRRAPLGVLAGARSGDKAGDANVGLWVRDPSHLPWLVAVAGSEEAVRSLLPEADGLPIEVHHLPNLLAVNVVVRGLLDEGVASALRPDPQAKGLGEYLRSRSVPVPIAWLDARQPDEAR